MARGFSFSFCTAVMVMLAQPMMSLNTANYNTTNTESLWPDEYTPVLDWVASFDPTGLSGLILGLLGQIGGNVPDKPQCEPTWWFELGNMDGERFKASVSLNGYGHSNIWLMKL